MTKPWHEMTALDLGHLIEDGSIDPTDLAQYFLDRIKTTDPDAKIFVRLTEERAMGEAKAAALRARRKERLSPLDGVPLSWKDLFDTAGVATEAGTKLLQGRTPDTDAACLTRATRAGLVCLGKTSMPDVAFSGLGLNPWTGIAPNPYDRKTERVTGGSSAGAALSVALGLAPAAIGSDTAGSVRIPSAWCGLTGFKPTFGRISLDGAVPLSYTQDSIGPLTRDVADASLLYSILSGTPAADLSGASLQGVKILRATSQFDDLADPAITARIGDALALLEAAGAEVTDGAIPAFDDVIALSSRHGTPAAIEACMMYRDLIRAKPGDMYGPIAERILAAEKFSAIDAAALYRGMERLTQEYLTQTAGFDLVVGPTQPEHPPAIAPLLEDIDAFLRASLMSISLTRLANLLRLCAITLPCGKDQGLPVGLMLMAPGNAEGKLLRLSAAAEMALTPLNV
ncbi:MAG: amidase [Sneathiella sp.]|jgi:aspartyl-tRNA(Asn)/glutamyl-tRNA(Gln) amidotransferase subunit A|uniref:amidase n=1 Tax=Sneathiella sp. TaxID=1964365 RepID=UPI000C5A5F62|nr:amidase family protein [Sneathiella sp.]MAL79026.1 amidase [Sneathiella sp.]